MAQTLILARSITEANRYARLAEMPRFSYRAVRNAGSIRGVRHAEVHMLSNFLTRPDRHAILAALRMARTLEVFYVDPADFEPPAAPEVDGEQEFVGALGWLSPDTMLGADARGPLTERDLTVAYRYEALREDPEAEAEEPAAPIEKAEAPARRRRSRCLDCGVLVWNAEDPNHGAPCNLGTPAPADDPFFS